MGAAVPSDSGDAVRRTEHRRGGTGAQSRPARRRSTAGRLSQVEAHLEQLRWAQRRALAAAARRWRVALNRADVVVGGVLLDAAFDGDWHRLAEWLAPRLDARARERLAEPLPVPERARHRRLYWVLARTGCAARACGSPAQSRELLAAVRACLATPRDRAVLDVFTTLPDAANADPQ